jgi:hypothetical protein
METGFIEGHSPRHEDDRHFVFGGPHPPDEIQPREARHVMIGDQRVKTIQAEGFPSRLSIFGQAGQIPGASQHGRHDLTNPGIVIDDEDDGGGGTPVCGDRSPQRNFEGIRNLETLRPVLLRDYGVLCSTCGVLTSVWG